MNWKCLCGIHDIHYKWSIKPEHTIKNGDKETLEVLTEYCKRCGKKQLVYQGIFIMDKIFFSQQSVV